MFLSPKKKPPNTSSVERENVNNKIQEFLETTNKFLKTTTGTITAFTLLLGAISGLSLTIVGFNFVQDPCSDSSKSIEHFSEQPIRTTPHTIKTEHGSVNMEISVYQNGDILTTYGTNRKWLCFPEVAIIPQKRTVTNSVVDFLIRKAVAQTTVSNVRKRTTYIQEQTLSRNNPQIIEQTRIYSNGTVEKTLINRRTGRIIQKNVTRITITPELQERLDRGVEVEETTIIDIRPQ
ncbi:MAG: hypothetical protein QNJ70_17715 [Xenococcaceae cyanobacterium MO_207.B15]|nr:hypothetical protein [Xenococcaceae cyanobacterium MO_207.B15]